MQTLRIRKRIDSEILYLPEFRNLIGRNVEIIIFADYDDTDETDIPNDETLRALAESSEKNKMRRFESTKELFEDMEI